MDAQDFRLTPERPVLGESLKPSIWGQWGRVEGRVERRRSVDRKDGLATHVCPLRTRIRLKAGREWSLYDE
jgi:hypothetical protein